MMMTQPSRYQKLNPGLLAVAAIMVLTHVMVVPLHAHGGGKHEITQSDSNNRSHHDQKATPPASSEQAWAMIRERMSRIESALATHDLESIHEVQKDISIALEWLQKDSSEGTDDKIRRLESALKQAIIFSGNLDAASGTGNQTKAEVEFKKLKGALKLIEAQHPGVVPGTLK